ncbi:MAG: hypothetical protein H0X30_28540 [Anaerolineae bacterium]|nr:hypothetical protein [Anaerolineae bacterium]
MTQAPILLQLPDEIYERLREIADDSQRPVESVLIDSLTLLFGNLPTINPQQLVTFSDEQLWALVHRLIAWRQDARLSELTRLSQQGSLSAADQSELESLIDTYDQYVLLRSKALLLLKKRGYNVEQHLKLAQTNL